MLQSCLSYTQRLAAPGAAPPPVALEAVAHEEALRTRFTWLLRSAERIRASIKAEGASAALGASGAAAQTVCVEELLYRHALSM